MTKLTILVLILKLMNYLRFYKNNLNFQKSKKSHKIVIELVSLFEEPKLLKLETQEYQ